MKKITVIFVFSFLFSQLIAQKDKHISLFSPDKKIELRLFESQGFKFQVYLNGNAILQPSSFALTIDGKTFPAKETVVKKLVYSSVNETIIPGVAQKRKQIQNCCNVLTLTYKEGNQLIFRAYDDGIAYRFVTRLNKKIKINDETANFVFTENDSLWYPKINDINPKDPFNNSFELSFPFYDVKDLTKDSLGPAPVLIKTQNGTKVAILESDVTDYPGMFIRGSSEIPACVSAVFPKYPIETEIIGDPYQLKSVKKRADFLVETNGERAYPWRVLMIAREDKDLLNSDLIYCLASPQQLTDISWIKPGKAMDNWIIDAILYNVDFISGNNTESYKYYIDFASEYGIEYMMVEPVWSNLHDIFTPVPEMNMKELFRYAGEKQVGLWLWTEALALEKNMEAILDTFQHWGAAGFMVDFFNRNDQITVNQFEKIAESAAKHHLLLMFHGAFPSSGFERRFPNALTREGVAGSEYNKWSNIITPDHNLKLPFIRGLSGPFDYEPIVLNNTAKGDFRIVNSHPNVQGTRAADVAKFIIYISPFQVIASSPVDFRKDGKIIRFLALIPTTWDETIPLDAKIGEFAVVARKKNNVWYVGGLTDWTSRNYNLNLDFADDTDYIAEILTDGINADREAVDYKIEFKKVKKGDKLEFKMASGGGFVIKLVPIVK